MYNLFIKIVFIFSFPILYSMQFQEQLSIKLDETYNANYIVYQQFFGKVK